MSKKFNITLTEYCLIVGRQKDCLFLNEYAKKALKANIGDSLLLVVEGTSLVIECKITNLFYIRESDKPELLFEHPLWDSFKKATSLSEIDYEKLAKTDKKAVVSQFEDYLSDIGCFSNLYAIKIANL